jgi:hypothetical protein
MFSILQQIKIAMSNKNDPYSYALSYQQSQLQGEQKNLVNNDEEMVEILGSMVNQDSEQSENDGSQNNGSLMQGGLFSKLSSVFGIGNKSAVTFPPSWTEFPWDDILVKTDVIKKWKAVDMKHVNLLLTGFDPESAKFTNLEESKSSQR